MTDVVAVEPHQVGAISVAADVFDVVEGEFVEQKVEEGAGQGTRAAWPDGQPFVRLLRRRAHVRGHRHHFHAPHAGVGHLLGHDGEGVVVSEARLTAEDEQIVAIGDVGASGAGGVKPARHDVLRVAPVVVTADEAVRAAKGRHEHAHSERLG